MKNTNTKQISLVFLFILVFSASGSYSQQSYGKIKQQTEQRRSEYNQQYISNSKGSVINEAQLFLLSDINKYFEAWYGTPWDFNGHTRTPRNGKIACGYFITTVLHDMGFRIPRIKWAQLGAEGIIKKMTTDIKRFRNAPMTDIVMYIKAKGEGLYIVGLDCHVGFVYYTQDKMAFVHSNYYRKDRGVMSEPLIGRNPLNDSKYRIIGKILDKEMTRKWILNTTFPE